MKDTKDTPKMPNNINLPGEMDEYIEANLGLVHQVCLGLTRVQSIYRSTLDYDDIFQAGSIGLLHAYNRYTGQGEFSTYATHSIRGEIFNLFRSTNHGARYTVLAKNYATKIKKRGLENETVDIVCDVFGINKRTAEGALDYISNGRPSSFSTPLTLGNDEDRTLEDIITDSASDACHWDQKLALDIFASTLQENQRKVMWALLDGYSTRQVAPILGISQTRITQIWTKILEKAEEYGNGVTKVHKKRGRPKKIVNAV